jgi:hypothetical protein
MVHMILFPMLNHLYFYISTSGSKCAVPNMAVFYSSLILCFSRILLRYFLNNSQIVAVAPIATGNTFLRSTHDVFLL